MKFYLVTLVLSIYVVNIQSRPQNVQVERQNIVLISRSLEPYIEQRGSVEETKRILKEIERINQAMGYKKKSEVALPRNNEEFFYPKPVYRPSNLRQADTEKEELKKHPFKEDTFFYPAPYLQLPSNEAPRKFRFEKYTLESKDQEKNGKQMVFLVPISVKDENSGEEVIEFIPNAIDYKESRDLKETNEEASEVKDLIGAPRQSATQTQNVVTDIKDTEKEKEKEEEENSIIDEIVDVLEVVGEEDFAEEEEDDEEDDEEEEEDEEEKVEITTAMPILPNDKFINTKHHRLEKGRKRKIGIRMQIGKNFNFTNVFQNFTNRFSSSVAPTMLPSKLTTNNLKESPLGEEGQDKGPFGLFSPTLAEKNVEAGGLVIQRLRVRQGGIAIAGPGGVATAGSGGTAIVGPNGTAITHPRSLTIAGPGAKVYAVPESVDLGIAVYNTTRTRKLPIEAVLVANGPAVYYHL